MVRNDLLRAMLRSLSDVQEQGDSFAMSDDWDVTVHSGRKGVGFAVAHVVKIVLQPEFVVIETHKGHRYVLTDEDIQAIGQEPSTTDRSGRKAGF